MFGFYLHKIYLAERTTDKKPHGLRVVYTIEKERIIIDFLMYFYEYFKIIIP